MSVAGIDPYLAKYLFTALQVLVGQVEFESLDHFYHLSPAPRLPCEPLAGAHPCEETSLRLPGWSGDKRALAELPDGFGDILGWKSQRTAPHCSPGTVTAIPDVHAQEGRSFSAQLWWRSCRAHFPAVLMGVL